MASVVIGAAALAFLIALATADDDGDGAEVVGPKPIRGSSRVSPTGSRPAPEGVDARQQRALLRRSPQSVAAPGQQHVGHLTVGQPRRLPLGRATFALEVLGRRLRSGKDPPSISTVQDEAIQEERVPAQN